jgi:cytochrome c-type biogenesis protein CcmF
MIDIGHFTLVSAWFLSAYALVIGTYAAWKSNPQLVRSAANAVHLCAGFSMLALLALIVAFVTHDYRYVYVWQTSNNAMPVHYLVSAVWGGMDGSMLLWAAIMSVFSSVVIWRGREVQRDLFKWLVPVLAGGTGFFLLVVTFLTNPFRLVPAGRILEDGNGLNPLLQNPSMMIHPPTLYMGFTGFVVPFAFCLAALLSGQINNNWIRLTRRWTLVAWGFLTAGIILGGNWAYIELGWGGFWAWDPVENASFMPWLTGTAFLHSVMVQEQKGMLKVWNVILAVTTYLLSVFGTFLTRSGVVQSVHAFAETDVGWVFLLYIGLASALTLGLIAVRWKELRPDRPLESYFSREAAFLFNNLALLGICFATFWGVMFPVISEAVAGEKSVVGPPFFNQVNVPLFLALIFLMGVGPLIAWRKNSVSALRKRFSRPFIAGSIVTAVFIFVDPARITSAIAFGLSVFAIATIESEFRRAAKNRRQLTSEGIATSYLSTVRRRPRRYGGFMVHLGVAVMAIAITASSAYKIEKDISLKAGESTQVGRYNLRLDGLVEERKSNYAAIVAEISVLEPTSSDVIGQMRPERRSYITNQEVTTEVALRITPREDLYIALAGLDVHNGSSKDLSTMTALFKVFVNPLQVWLWFGGIIVMFGTGIVLLQGLINPQSVTLAEMEATEQAWS